MPVAKRIWDGAVFVAESYHEKKVNAQRVASKLRNQKYRARITREGKYWQVWRSVSKWV